MILIAGVLALVKNQGGGISFAEASDSRSRVIATHALFGKVILALVAIQLIAGFVRPHKKEHGAQTAIRSIWEKSHKNMGRFLALFAITTCFLGIWALEWKQLFTKVLFVFAVVTISLLATLFMLLQLRSCMSARRSVPRQDGKADSPIPEQTAYERQHSDGTPEAMQAA